MLSRQNPFGLIVALDDTFSATGDLYYDDGITKGKRRRIAFVRRCFTNLLPSVEAQQYGIYFLSTITYKEGTLTQTVRHNGYSDISRLNLETVRIFGAPTTIDKILVNDEPHIDFEILPGNEIRVHNVKVRVNSGYTINFTTDTGSSSAKSLFGYSWMLVIVSFAFNLFKLVQ